MMNTELPKRLSDLQYEDLNVCHPMYKLGFVLGRGDFTQEQVSESFKEAMSYIGTTDAETSPYKEFRMLPQENK